MLTNIVLLLSLYLCWVNWFPIILVRLYFLDSFDVYLDLLARLPSFCLPVVAFAWCPVVFWTLLPVVLFWLAGVVSSGLLCLPCLVLFGVVLFYSDSLPVPWLVCPFDSHLSRLNNLLVCLLFVLFFCWLVGCLAECLDG